MDIKNLEDQIIHQDQIVCGDCLDVLKQCPDESVDLIMTSPPYADNRKNTYGGIRTNEYVEWFLPRSKEFFRVLKKTGTFILNIKEKVENCERSTYVLELIIELKKQGWLWTEEFIWHKKNSFPGKWSNRFRDAWERCLQFNKSKQFSMYQDEVKVPIGSWADSRLKNLSENDKSRYNANNNSGFGKKVSNWVGRESVYPTNVLYLATECSNKRHSAAFPETLPEWFIKLFTKEQDIVLDPFIGSGTTAVVAKRLRRHYIGIDIVPEYCTLTNKHLMEGQKMNYEMLTEFINNNIAEFHENRLKSLSNLRLDKVLKKKNPYLFRAKNIQTSGELVKTIVDAYLSSQEETIFGGFLERVAIFACGNTMGGYKSGMEGIDLEIIKDNIRYIITIKSGPNWGNSGQIIKMKDNFKKAARILRTQNSGINVVSINGCCYGVDNKPDKGDYIKLCGQRFWQFITGDDNFYLDIIEPLGYKAKEKNDDFYKEYAKVLNNFTRDFSNEYCTEDGEIDWEKIVKLNSEMKR